MESQIETLRQTTPCCRTFFFSNQILHHAQSTTLQYKNFKFPYDKYCVTQLRRAICAFLNRAGGVILVGISERNQDKCREVKGQVLSQNKKEEVLKEYRYICQQIQPDIVSQGKYSIKFVPIKQLNNGKYIPGKYIIRVEVVKGDDKSFYTIKQILDNEEKQIVAFRTPNEVLKRQINQQTLTKFKQKLLNPPKHPPTKHYPQPQIGEPIIDEKWRQKRRQRQKTSQNEQKEHSIDRNGRSQKWKSKQQPSSSSKVQSKIKESVYYNDRNCENENLQKKHRKRNGFVCDEDDQHSSNEKKEQKSKKKQQSTKQQINNIQKEFEKLKINCNSPNASNASNHQYSVINMLIAGFPCREVKPLIITNRIKLKEDPIRCKRTENNHCNNDQVTWIKIVPDDLFRDKIEKFMSDVKRMKDNMLSEKQLKIRKLFSNVYFKDSNLLKKLVEKFGKNEEFRDEIGVYYFACQNNQQAITAYIIGWELNIKIKFISNEDMLLRKQAYQQHMANM